MVPFSYTPFSTEREIRLLDIIPGRGQIKCNLRKVLLSSENEYEALSYCWGAPTKKTKILVDNADFEVTRNLHAALRRLRDEKITRTLWVDAICIDQNNIQEKNVQVPLMHIIYGTCRRVVIWLGEEDFYTKTAFAGFEYMAFRFDAREELIDPKEWKRVKRGDTWGYSWFTPRQVIERDVGLRAFPSIFERPWFKRVWVIQELALGPDPLVVCGSHQISWEKLEKANNACRIPIDVDGQFGNLCAYRKNWRDPSLNVFSHALWGWQKQVTDPRDKLYGFLGLATEQSNRIPIKVDYASDPEQIFTEVTTQHLLTFSGLMFLGCCRGVRPSGPSWILNFEYDETVDPAPAGTLGWSESYKAGGNEPRIPTFSADGKILIVQGYVLDEIVDISPQPAPLPRKEGIASIMMRINLEWALIANFFRLYLCARKLCNIDDLGIYKPTSQPIREALGQTITSSWKEKQDDLLAVDIEDLLNTFDDHVAKAADSFNIVPGNLGILLIYAKTFYAMPMNADGVSPFSQFYAKTDATWQRRFVTMANGHIGLAPARSEVGDKVVLLQGYRAPVAARRAGNRWKLVGDCYVHGIMGGEVFDGGRCEAMEIE